MAIQISESSRRLCNVIALRRRARWWGGERGVLFRHLRRLLLMVSSRLAAIIEPKKIAIVTSAQSGKLSITIPGICAPSRPFSSPSGLSLITPPKGRSHTASEPVVRAHHRETLGIANPCRRLPKLRKGDLLLPLPRLAGQERPHVVLRAVVNGAADAAIEIEFDDKQVVGVRFRVAECY